MNDKASTSSSWGKVLLILSFIAIACIGIRTVSNDSVWTHLAAGQQGLQKTDTSSFSMEGAQDINNSWLYDIILNAIWSDSGAVAIILHVILMIAAFLLLYPAAKRWGNATVISGALLLSAWLIAPRFNIGSAIPGLLFTALFVSMLENKHKPWILFAVLLPIQILWTNMHAGFLIGPAICLIYTIQTAMNASDQPPAAGGNTPKMLGILTAVILAGTLLNPYGLAVHIQAISSWINPALGYTRTWISPFNSSGQSATKGIITLALFIGAAGLMTQRKKLPLALTALAVLSAFTMIFFKLQLNSFLWFGLLGFPFFCLSLSALGDTVGGALQRRKNINLAKWHGLIAVIIAVLLLMTLWQFCTNRYYNQEESCSRFGLGVEYGLFPKEALAVIGHEAFPKQALNMIKDGAFLSYHLPGRQVFTDARAEVYGRKFYNQLNLGLRGDPDSWKALTDEWNPEAVIINLCNENFGVTVRHLLMSGQWVLVYFDGTTAIFVTQASGFSSLIAKTDLQNRGLEVLDRAFADYQKAVNGIVKTPVPARLTGAGGLFMNMRRYEKAQSVYELLTVGVPGFAQAWYSLGMCQLNTGRPEEAAKSFDKTVRLARKNALSWLWLSRAHAQLGNDREARYAYNKAMRLNSAMANTFGDPLEDVSGDEQP